MVWRIPRMPSPLASPALVLSPGGRAMNIFDSNHPGHDSCREYEQIVVNDPSAFLDPWEFALGMFRASSAICRVENPAGRALGTGFLIGPHLLMTNHHVGVLF